MDIDNISSENMEKMLKNYANYKNICNEFKKEKEAEKVKYSTNLPSFSIARRNRNVTFSTTREYSSEFLDPNQPNVTSTTDDELLEKQKNFSEDSDSNQEWDLEQSKLRKRYKDRFKKRTAEMQQELDQLRQDQQMEIEAHESAMQSIEEELKKEKSDNSDRCRGVASHYDHMLLRTKQLSCRLEEDHSNVECKMNSLREQVGSLQSELQGWLKKNFDEMMTKFDAFGNTPEDFKLNFVDGRITDENKVVRAQEQAELKYLKEMKCRMLKEPDKPTKPRIVRFEKPPCPRLNRGRFS